MIPAGRGRVRIWGFWAIHDRPERYSGRNYPPFDVALCTVLFTTGCELLRVLSQSPVAADDDTGRRFRSMIGLGHRKRLAGHPVRPHEHPADPVNTGGDAGEYRKHCVLLQRQILRKSFSTV
jgi:hypothetical protein